MVTDQNRQGYCGKTEAVIPAYREIITEALVTANYITITQFYTQPKNNA